MADPFVADPDFTLYVGDALAVLRELPADSVHCCVTSPPYLGLRDYGHTEQIGLEPTIGEYIAALVAVFGEVRRVLRADGTLWLNLGDSYNAYNGGAGPGSKLSKIQTEARPRLASGFGLQQKELKPKDLMGIPWRVAFALQADGWYLRSDIIWSKPNPMPESVTDRPTKAHEYLFLLTRSPRYFYDADAIAEPAAWDRWGDQTVGDGSMGWIPPKAKPKLTGGAYAPPGQPPHGNARKAAGTPRNDGERWNENDGRGFVPVSDKRNKRSVWEIPTRAYPDAHFAVFPPDLIQPCIAAGSSEHGCCGNCGAPWVRIVDMPQEGKPDANAHKAHGGIGNNLGGARRQAWRDENPPRTVGWRPTCRCWDMYDRSDIAACVVLDPFMGSGTTALVARRLGRRSIGVELNPEYAALAARRLSQLSLLASTEEVA